MTSSKNETPEEGGRRPSGWLVALLFGGLALAAFAPGLSGAFLNYDDDRTILGNPAFALPFGRALLRILDPTQTIADVYLPVTYLSLGIDRVLFGFGRPLWWHLHSLLLAVLVAWQAFRLLEDLGFPRAAAFLGGLPFVVHPVLPESAVWLSGRKDLLAAFFVLLTLRAGLRRLRAGGALWPLFPLTLSACYAKGTALVLPFLAALIWFGPAGLRGRAGAGRALGWVGAAALLAAIHHEALARVAGTADFAPAPAALPGTFLHYLTLLVAPIAPAVHYPREAFLARLAAGAPVKALYLVFLVAAAWLAARRRHPVPRAFGFGLLVVFAALLPFNNVFPATAAAAADRYLHLALLGLGLALAGAGIGLARGFGRAAPWVFGLFVAAVALPAVRRRAADFRSSQALWAANLARFPEDPVALYNLGLVHFARGTAAELELARALFEQAALHARHDAHRLKAAVQLFRCARELGRDREAAVHAETAVRLADRLAGGLPPARRRALRRDLRLEYAEALERAGRGGEVGPLLDEVLALDPENADALAWKARRLLAGRTPGAPARQAAERLIARAEHAPRAALSLHLALARARRAELAGRLTEALKELNAYRRRLEAARVRPPEDLWLAVSEIYLERGVPEGALEALGRGLRLHPGSARLLTRSGLVLERLGRFAEAERRYRAALELSPLDPVLRRGLARVLAARARSLVAREDPERFAALVEEARGLDPDLPSLPYLEAVLLRRRGRLPEALAKAEAAVRADPRDTLAATLRLDLLKELGYRELARGEAVAFRRFRRLLALAPPEYPTEAVREVLRSEFERRVGAGDRALERNDLQAAERAYRAALELFPAQEGALRKLGLVLFATGRAAEAVAPLRRSVDAAVRLRLDPGLALVYLVRALCACNRVSEAREVAAPFRPGGPEAGLLRDRALRERFGALLAVLDEAGGTSGRGGAASRPAPRGAPTAQPEPRAASESRPGAPPSSRGGGASASRRAGLRPAGGRTER